MKTSLLFFIALFVSSPLIAQSNLFDSRSSAFEYNDRRTETLLTRGTSYGGFGALLYGVTDINGQSVYLTGRRFALAINIRPHHTLNLGIGSYRSQSDFDPESWSLANVEQPEMQLEYSGFEVEYVNRTRKLFHVGVQLLVGSGSVEYNNRNILVEKTKDTYFVLQPGLNLNLNVTTWLRFNAGVYYRYTDSVSLPGTSDNGLSGFSGVMGFRIGSF